MTRHSGFVVWHLSRATHRLLHRLLLLVMALLVLASIGLAVGLWKLAQGPMDGLWLANRINAALTRDASPVRVAFGAVSLSWNGFHAGATEPLDLRATGLVLTDAAGATIGTATQARLVFAVTDLLLGRIFPRSVEVDDAHLLLTRQTVDLLTPAADQPPADALSPATPRSGPQTPAAVVTAVIPAPLRRVHLRNAAIAFRDPAEHLAFDGRQIDLSLNRQRDGRIRGLLTAPVTIGAGSTLLNADIDLDPAGRNTATLRLAPFRPAAMGVSDRLAFLRPIDAPLSVTATATLDRRWYPAHLRATVSLGAGQLRLGRGAVPVLAASATLAGSPAHMRMTGLHLDLLRAADGGIETLDATGALTHAAGRISGDLAMTLAHIDAADIPRIWPPGIGDNVRNWITEHVMAGSAQGQAALTLEADDALRDITVTHAQGTLDVSGGTFTWMSHMPPVQQAEAHLRLVDADTLDIQMPAARQQVAPGQPDILATDGHMRITGLSLKDQYSDIGVTLKGPITSVMTLLAEPRLKLLSAHPVALKPDAGEVSGSMTFKVPLKNDLDIDDIDLQGRFHLAGVHLPDAAGAHALNDGAFDMTVDKTGMSFKGTGTLAAVPLTLTGAMSFQRPSTPDQVMLRLDATGAARGETLAAAGVPFATLASGGPIPLTAAVRQLPNGIETIRLTGDLTPAALTVTPLGYHKPPGTAARLAATLRLANGHIVAIEPLTLQGEDLDVAGTATLPAGQTGTVRFDRLVMGRTDASFTARIAPAGHLTLAVSGRALDLGAWLTRRRDPDAPQATTPPWRLDGRVAHVFLAHGEAARGLTITAAGAGDRLDAAEVTGTMDSAGQPQAGKGGGFSLHLAGAATNGRRALRVQAADAGRFLRGIDAVRTLNGGSLAIDAGIAAPNGLAPMAGTVRLDGVVVRNSPFLAKLLQAITLYGLLDALRGPGMTFDRVSLPFRYDGRDLYLDNAVADNTSLGLTAAGRVGLGPHPSDLTGTIVPAYFFNTLPGRIPLIGRLFSPEKGGGVFAWRFTARGPIADPDIAINPVSALTPGFLRGLFGLFDGKPPSPQPIPTAPTAPPTTPAHP